MSDWVQKYHESQRGQKGGPGSGHHGHAGRPGQVGGSAPGKGGAGTVSQRFGGSKVGQTLDALNRDFDFVLTGSAAARLHVGTAEGGEPHDLDVLDLNQKREGISNRWDIRRDPRASSATYNIIDRETGVQVQVFEAGKAVERQLEGTAFRTTFRWPYLFDTTGTPKFEKVAGVDVLNADVLLQSYQDGGRDELIPRMIQGLGLPRDYVDTRWYRYEWDEAHEQ